MSDFQIDYEAEGMTACEVCGVPFHEGDDVGFDRQMRFAHERCGGGTANTHQGGETVIEQKGPPREHSNDAGA